LRVSRRLQPSSSARRTAKYRLTHVRLCWWRNVSFARRPRLPRAFSGPPARFTT
jgi:hypothetical protein